MIVPFARAASEAPEAKLLVENQDHYRKTLRYAEALAGSPAQLAHLLDVDSKLLSAWFRGTQAVPEDVFLKLIDIVLAATKKDLERSRSYQHSQDRP
jgi:DNA-binding transcriptional regulator YiaG